MAENTVAQPSNSADINTSDNYHELFNEADGDMVLKSRDGVLFKTYVFTLRRCSAFFGSMFALPQASAPPLQQLPTLTLDENSIIIAAALLMISGMAFPPELFEDICHIEEFLQFCEKYGMPGPLAVVRSAVQRHSLLITTPHQVYSIACRFNWPEVAQAAAMHCLSCQLTSSKTIAALRGTSIADFGRLLELARARADTFRQRLDDPEWFRGSALTNTCHGCGQPSGDLTWKVLRMKMIEEFERCPSGDTIRDESMMQWPEWKSCMSASHCNGRTLFVAVATRSTILRALQGLPESLIITFPNATDNSL